MEPEQQWRKCEKCKSLHPTINLYLCKGKMICQGCYMDETRGNTVAFDESKYPRTD